MKKTCVRQQSLMQQASLPKKEGDGDAAACSTDTSRWSTPSELDWGSDGPQYGRGDKANFLIDKTPDNHPSLKWKGPKKSGFKKDKNVQEAYNPSTNRQSTRLPPVKPLPVSTSNVHSASTNGVKELKSQVWALQQQLSEARTENKLLKKVQHRHTVALQHFQDSEGSISQILAKHNNETRVLQGLLRETRIISNNATRQLQATESKLLETKAALQYLELLSQDQSLLEREELSLRLAEAKAKLEDKDRKIQDMERNLALCQASFKRQIVTEQRKIKEATMASFYQQQQIYQLTTEIQDREKELEQQNIYSHRHVKGSSKKVRKNKTVQTDGLVHITASGSHLLMTQHSVTEQQEISVSCHCQEQEDLDEEALEEKAPPKAALENHQKDTQMLAGQSAVFKESSSENICSEESPEDPLQQQTAKGKEASEKLQVCEEKQDAEHEAGLSCVLEMSLNVNEPNRKECYSFKQTIKNLHNGQPAYSSAESTDDSPKRMMTPSSGI